MFGIIFNDIHSSNFNIVVKTIINPLLPKLRISEQIIPNKSSSYKFLDGYEDKVIKVTLKLIDNDYIERRKTARLVAKWLSGKGKLYFDYEPDKYYIAQVFDQVEPQIEKNIDTMEVTFLCEPLAVSDENGIIKNNITNSETVILINNGTYKSKPVFEITGTATSITFASDGGSFSISDITEKTIVNCKNMLCYTVDGLEQKTNKLKDFTGNFIEVEPGLTEVAISGTSLNVNVTIKINDTYL